MTDDVSDRAAAIIADVTGADESNIVPEMSLARDLEIEWPDTCELIPALDDEFQLSIHDADVQEMETIENLIDYVDERCGEM